MIIAPRPTFQERTFASNLLTNGSSNLTASRSTAFWAALRGLEKNSEAAELAAAGVSQRRIEILYPLEFAHIIPGIIDFITPEKYADIDDNEAWNGYAALPKDAARANSSARKALDIETSRFMSTVGYRELRDHIQACLPGEASARHAKAMTLALWYCWWGMLHLEGKNLPYRLRMERALDKTMDWVLPGLH